jgi:hypothetical protein
MAQTPLIIVDTFSGNGLVRMLGLIILLLTLHNYIVKLQKTFLSLSFVGYIVTVLMNGIPRLGIA